MRTVSNNQQANEGFGGDDGFESDNGSFAEQLDLQHYLRILRKHKWIICLFTALVTGLAGYYAFTATPVYSSTSTLLIESQGNNLVQFEELVGLDTENQDYYQTQFELLRSRGLAVRVIDEMNLWNHPELSPAAKLEKDSLAVPSANSAEAENILDKLVRLFNPDPAVGNAADGVIESPSVTLNLENTQSAPLTAERSDSQLSVQDVFGSNDAQSLERRRVVDAFMARLGVTPVRKTKLVRLSFESTDPAFAADVANTVGEQYIESYLDAKLELTTQASQWLNERLRDLKGTLDLSEDRLIAFKQDNGLVDVDGSVGRLNEQELLLATAELAQARSELSSQQDLFREVQTLRDQPELLESIPAIQADPLVQRVKIEQGQAQRALDELRNRYGDRHPRVVDATSQLATLNTTLQGHIGRVVGTVSNDFQLLRQRVASIESKLLVGKQEIQAIGTKKFELDELEREVLTNREIYDTFFSRITEAKSADGLETANARISDPAVPAINPVKPKKQLIIALAALASLVLSMLMAFLYEQMDDTIKSTADIESKLGLKLLGILPLIKGGMFSRSQSLPLNPAEIEDAKGTFAESVNTARTALCMDDGDGKARKVFVVTSSVPGEGKSTTAINLAYSLGQMERVLLIDCDMRRPTIAKAAGLDKNVSGLSSLISQTATARECIKRGVFDGAIDILPSGPIPEQPLELLASKRFEKILEQLCKHYDRIVLDSAPTQAVSDALVLSRLSDSVIYAIKSHDTSIELVRRGVQRLQQVNAPIAGAIITQVDINKITSYGGDYYYQGYYDYYGYTDKGERGKKGGKLKLTQEELYEIRTDDREIDLGIDSEVRSHRPVQSAILNDEFDLTAELDGFTRPQRRSSRAESAKVHRGKSKEASFDDGLDIL